MQHVEFHECGRSFIVVVDGREVGLVIWLGMYEPKTYIPDEKMAQYLSDTIEGTAPPSWWRKQAETLVTWSTIICTPGTTWKVVLSD